MEVKNLMVFSKEWYKTHKHPRGMLRKKHSIETKLKMSIFRKGKTKSIEWRQAISESKKGIPNPILAEYNREIKPIQMLGKNNPSKRPEVKKLISQKLRGKTTSPKTLFRFGSLNPAWKGGISSANKKIRESKKYQSWRKSVFERDNYICQECGIHNGNGYNIYLSAHHIKSYAKYPGLRFEVSNGITLCIWCHKKTSNFGRNLLWDAYIATDRGGMEKVASLELLQREGSTQVSSFKVNSLQM